MSGKNARLKAFASRKQLLIAESDLNRAQLIHEWQSMAREVRALSKQATTLSALGSVAGLLATGLSAFRHRKSASTPEKPSWWQTLLKFSGVASSIWLAFRSQTRANDN